MLKVQNLSLSHKGSESYVLSELSFDAERASITTILGPNGSGKTSILKCISGVWSHFVGEISFDSIRIDRLSPRERAKLISLVPQEHDPPFPYSVYEVVLMGRAAYVGLFSSPGRRDHEVTRESLKTVGILELMERRYTEISGGERQLTLIARALAQEAPIMLLDEPTAHLDFRNQINVLRRIKEVARKKKLVILMTLHDPNLASIFSDKVIILNSGKKVKEGRPEDVITEETIERIYGVDVERIEQYGRAILMPKPDIEG